MKLSSNSKAESTMGTMSYSEARCSLYSSLPPNLADNANPSAPAVRDGEWGYKLSISQFPSLAIALPMDSPHVPELGSVPMLDTRLSLHQAINTPRSIC